MDYNQNEVISHYSSCFGFWNETGPLVSLGDTVLGGGPASGRAGSCFEQVCYRQQRVAVVLLHTARGGFTAIKEGMWMCGSCWRRWDHPCKQQQWHLILIKAVGAARLAFQTSHDNPSSHLYRLTHSVPYTLLELLHHSPFSTDRQNKIIRTLLRRFECKHVGVYFCWFVPFGKLVWSAVLGYSIHIFVSVIILHLFCW